MLNLIEYIKTVLSVYYRFCSLLVNVYKSKRTVFVVVQRCPRCASLCCVTDARGLGLLKIEYAKLTKN